MPFLHRVPAIPPQQRASELWAGRLRTHPGAPLLMASLWKEHQTSSPKYTGTKAGFFWPVSDFMGFVDFFDRWADVGNRLPAKGEQQGCSFISQSLHFALPTANSAPVKTLITLCLFVVLGGERKRALLSFPGWV